MSHENLQVTVILQNASMVIGDRVTFARRRLDARIDRRDRTRRNTDVLAVGSRGPPSVVYVGRILLR